MSTNKWNEEVASRTLYQLLPDVAIKMETSVLKQQLIDLGVKFSIKSFVKKFRIIIPTEDNFTIYIEPVDKGFDDFSEWFSWHFHRSRRSQNVSPFETVEDLHKTLRVHLKIFKNDHSKEFIGFTSHQTDLKGAIVHALEGIYNHFGVKTSPIPSC